MQRHKLSDPLSIIIKHVTTQIEWPVSLLAYLLT